MFQIWISFVICSLILFQLELSRTEVPKLTPSILMTNCDHSICPGWSILSFYDPAHKAWKLARSWSISSFKIACILLTQVIPLNKIVVSSAKFTILVSWSPIRIPLILINEIDNPWWTTWIRTKGSDRRPF